MSFSFSSSVDAFRISDEVFADAYDALGDRRRSVLKKWISHLYLFWGRERALYRTQGQRWDQGIITREHFRPLDWTFFVLSPDFSSPAQLLAAVLPALLASVRRVAVVREEGDTPFPEALLTSMELAGQELVLEMNSGAILEMTEEMFTENRRGRVCFLGRSSLETAVRAQLPAKAILSLAASGSTAGIWFDEGVPWNTETLAWTLPDTVFYAGGKVPEQTDLKMIRYTGSSEDFGLQGFDVLYASTASLTGDSPSIFGHGLEGGWLWPGLTPQVFMDTVVNWQVDMTEEQGENHDGA